MKKSTYFSIMLVFVTSLFSSCAKMYYSSDAMQRASTHKIIAIIPPKVSIPPSKNIDAAAIKAQQENESSNFQSEIYAWLLKRKRQGKIFVDIQDLDFTNAKLKKLDYMNNPMPNSQLCKELGVDGIVTSKVSLAKTMSEGAVIGIAILTGGFASNKSATIDLSINDSEKLLFNYSHKMSGGIASSPASMVDNLMRKVSKKIPYAKTR
jgi:fructose-bisphosphate aldolase class 1